MEFTKLEKDPAAVFACASSLWKACHKVASKNPHLDLSEAYNGYDELMREVMRISESFEEWACEKVRFETLSQVWPYLLERRFGVCCIELFPADQLMNFSRADCLSVGLRLGLPIKFTAAELHQGLEL